MIKNLTPHEINIVDEEGQPITTIPQSGLVARIATESKWSREYDGIALYRTTFVGDPVVLDAKGNEHPFPEWRPDTLYIVSGTFRAHYDRNDLWQPGRLIRDSEGKVIGCIGLSR